MQASVTAPVRPNSVEPAERSQTSSMNVREPERLASVIAGGALAIYGLRSDSARLPTLLVGGYLLYRGLSGHCPIYNALDVNSDGSAVRPYHIEHTMTIAAEPEAIYRLWRDFSNLPRFMHHLKEVQVINDRYSHWVVRAPAGMAVTWDAEIFLERENELIAWRSLPNAQIVNAGSVRFTPASGGRGTEVKVILEYVPPAGALGRVAARMFGEEPSQ